MVLVGDDSQENSKFPWVTLAIVLINILVFAAQRRLGEKFDMAYSLVPKEITTGKDVVGPRSEQIKLPVVFRDSRGNESVRAHTKTVMFDHASGPKPIWLTLITSMFMHGGLAHIISNLWFLLVFGPSVERALNPWRFLIFYLISGVAGGLVFVWQDPESTIPCLGASGAISGVLGGYLAVHPLKRIKVLLLFWVVRIPALIILGLWVLEQWLAAEMTASSGLHTGVAYSAHIGGFLAGSVLCWGAILYANFSEAFQKKEHPDFDVRAGMIIKNELPSNLATARFMEQPSPERASARSSATYVWKLCLALVIAGSLAAMGVYVGLPIYRTITAKQSLIPEKFAAIRVGMTERDVQGILGVPAGDYTGAGTGVPFTNVAANKSWMGPEYGVTVYFDKNGRVNDVRTFTTIAK